MAHTCLSRVSPAPDGTNPRQDGSLSERRGEVCSNEYLRRAGYEDIREGAVYGSQETRFNLSNTVVRKVGKKITYC